jgi:hypothetical protein
MKNKTIIGAMFLIGFSSQSIAIGADYVDGRYISHATVEDCEMYSQTAFNKYLKANQGISRNIENAQSIHIDGTIFRDVEADTKSSFGCKLSIVAFFNEFPKTMVIPVFYSVSETYTEGLRVLINDQ